MLRKLVYEGGRFSSSVACERNLNKTWGSNVNGPSPWSEVHGTSGFSVSAPGACFKGVVLSPS